ncbi:MAG: protein kinase, partial [Verrucomicrobiaceae bacterium]|nr:protein kinase [Verrucomicrobiaceae bacterium]
MLRRVSPPESMYDHFQPEKLLAAGPGAKVYRGVETMTGRKVLLKVLLADHEATHAYDREKLQLLVPSLMHVRHPQIAGFITLLPTEEEFALVYEFMPGMNARQFAAERQITPTDLRALAVQLLNALLVGEHMRLPHGDPKPSNLIVADHPAGGLFLQLQDWGLSQARAEQPPETLWFRAPELHHGAPMSSQSDLFTAGAALFCLATNSAPAQAANPEELVAEWQQFNIGSLRLMRPDIDQAFSDWLGWLMQVDPARRPGSVAQALDSLMLSMHTGFIQMPPRQAPVMEPGFQTGQLQPGGHPNAPKAKPVQPKTTAAAASGPATAKDRPVEPPKPKRSAGKMALIIGLNFAALLMIGLVVIAMTGDGGGGWKKTKDAIYAKLGFSVSLAPAAPADSAAIPKEAAASDGTKGLAARYLRIEIKGGGILNLAEVQVFSGAENIAPKGKAKQNS